jgi:hypothetical protein
MATMRSTIYKYVFPYSEMSMDIPMWETSKVVHVGRNPSSDQVAVWVLHASHDPLDKGQAVNFTFVGTGWDFDSNLEHVGTAIIDDGYVWHVMRHSGNV